MVLVLLYEAECVPNLADIAYNTFSRSTEDSLSNEVKDLVEYVVERGPVL
jgi:hypothetical protein